MCAALSGDAGSCGAAGLSYSLLEEFLLEQSWQDTLHSAFNQVMKINVHMVHLEKTFYLTKIKTETRLLKEE